MHVVCMVARYQFDLKESHIIFVKRIFRYLKGTMDYGLWHPKKDDFMLCAYIDVDWAGDVCKEAKVCENASYANLERTILQIST